MSANPSKPVTTGATLAREEDPSRAVIAGYPPAGRYSPSAGDTTGMLYP